MEHNESTLLWLDDLRNPEHYLQGNTLLQVTSIVWICTFEQFVDWILKNGLPDYISFDHDLHKEHYTPGVYWWSYEESKTYQLQQYPTYKEKTGKHCAEWLVQYCKENSLALPNWMVHSANPVGADWIREVLLEPMLGSVETESLI